MARDKTGKKRPALDKARVLELLAQNPQTTKRDLARTLGLKGADRIALKRILKELESEGAVERGRKRTYAKPGTLPDVTVVEITGQDADGDLIVRPVRWDSDSEPPRIWIAPGKETGAASLNRGERFLARLSETRNGYEAKIIKHLGASVHSVLGVIHISGNDARIAPIDRKTRLEFMVDSRDLNGAKANELVLAEPLAGRSSGLPRARVMQKLGSMNEPKTVSLIAIHAHGIPTEFPKEALDQAANAQPAELDGRTDMRNIPLVTIDPEDARDHDDAIWAGPDDDPKNKGGHIVIVAIADVAHYVTPGSPLDREALKRGNSVYFPDRVVPMLPERLSADLCSLREEENRPCLAVRMVFDAGGNKKHHTFMRGLMRSAAKLTYAQAQTIFEGEVRKDKQNLANNVLLPIWNAYQALAKARGVRDPLDLDLPERRIIIGDDGKVTSIAFRERLESMRLIEEFMIMANVAAAETLEKARTPLLFRIHEEPSKEKLASFSDFLRTLGMSFAKGQVTKPGIFNRTLKQAKDTPHAAVMNDVVLRTQSQAIYSPDNIGHFGLNLSRYAHFTSPIRRYADLIVHRALIRALHLGKDGLTDGEMNKLGEIADSISKAERRAMAAERDSTDRYVAAYMENQIGAQFDARITGVTRFGLFVRLRETGAEGLVPARSLGVEYFRHDERKHALIGERSKTAYKLGDTIPVRLMEAAPLTGGLRFELADASAPVRRNSGPAFKPNRSSRPRKR
ncbi:MAG TPA: ribonuclease R [Rhizomicrobium sp.]|nr:ribonuclease R [Rhizomicrobium sp.]